LAFIIYFLDKGCTIERNEQGFPYTYRKKYRVYYPDFLVDGEYCEVKGIMNARNRAKIAAFPHPIRVYELKEMKPILAYVEKKHGKDYIRLFRRTRKASLETNK
jgi:hypothetical protein